MQRTLRLMEAVLIAGGLALLGYAGYAWMSAKRFQARERAEIDRAPRAARAVPLAEGSLLGEIDIPRIGVSAVILEGTEAGTLRRAVGHIRGTALPGQRGNLCLAGHRDTFFRPLRKISAGDEVLIKTGGRPIVYRVESMQVVDPEDVQVLDRTPQDTLTLVTCYPFHYIGAAPKRFIVRAVKA